MRYGVGSYLGLDKIESPSLMMIFIIISYLFNRTFCDLSIMIFVLAPYVLVFGKLNMILKNLRTLFYLFCSYSFNFIIFCSQATSFTF